MQEDEEATVGNSGLHNDEDTAMEENEAHANEGEALEQGGFEENVVEEDEDLTTIASEDPAADQEADQEADERRDTTLETEQDGQDAAAPSTAARHHSTLGLALPLARVKRLVKSEGNIQYLSTEAGVLIAKATELFLEAFVQDSFERVSEKNRTSLLYRNLATAVAGRPRYEFLADIVPQKVRVSDIPSIGPSVKARTKERQERSKLAGQNEEAVQKGDDVVQDTES
eukprot:jgi/Mesen1/3611/ME000020S03146